MPPLVLHTTVVKSVADTLRLNLLEEQRGNLYLGSTAPDIRVVTRWGREKTHFFDLRNFDEQSGTQAFLQTYPQLARPASLRSETAAFVAGYLTHLVMDERWISMIYRPYFGERSPLGGGLRANVMDRAMQFSMDHERRHDSQLMAHIVSEVARCELALDIGFLEPEDLGRWRQIVVQSIEQAPGWERFRQAARRHFGSEHNEDGVEPLLASVPDLVDETLRYLTPQRIQEYLDCAFQESLAIIKEYLECE
jgi:hypothetical protein